MPDAQSHEALLTSFYRREPPVAIQQTATEARWWIESDRRVLDTLRIAWRFWPLVCTLGTAHEGPEAILGVARRLPDLQAEAPDVDNAVRYAIRDWCRETEPPYLTELWAYESATRGLVDGLRPATPEERRPLPLDDETQEAWCLDTTINLPPYVDTLNHYMILHATPAMIRALRPTPHPGRLAFWRRAGVMKLAVLEPIETTETRT